jgi:hypothetical protein
MLVRFRLKIKTFQEEERVHLTTYAYGIVSCKGKLRLVIDFQSLLDRTLSSDYTKREGHVILVQ